MWFKNIRVFQFEAPIKYEPDLFSKSLSALAFKPCPKSLPISYGFVPPIDEEDAELAFGQNPFMLIRLRIEEKVLPPAVVREQLSLEINQLENKAGRRIYKDEKERLKDEVYQTLLSSAFTKSSYINGYIDTQKNWLIVDCASNKKTATFVSLLNKCIDNQAYGPDVTSIPRVMTQWLLNNNYPSTFAFADACLLKELDDNGSVVRVKNEDLLCDKIQSFLKDGSVVTQLALEWSDQMRFTLKEDFSLSSVKFLEAVKELARDGMSETKAERLSADFIIMAKTIQQFLNDLLPSFAENKQEEPALA
jgi:recombination associated protein RdgC